MKIGISIKGTMVRLKSISLLYKKGGTVHQLGGNSSSIWGIDSPFRGYQFTKILKKLIVSKILQCVFC